MNDEQLKQLEKQLRLSVSPFTRTLQVLQHYQGTLQPTITREQAIRLCPLIDQMPSEADEYGIEDA